jgi:ankyrin repeat protein
MIALRARATLLGVLFALTVLPAIGEEQKTLGANDQPIHDAARMGNAKDVERILKATPGVRDVKTALGSQPVHLAAANPDSGPLKALLAAGADANAKDLEGATPLHLAVYIQSTKNTQILLDAGADPKAKTNAGRDVLSMARKAMANEAAGVISLWILKDCQPKKPC